MTFMLGSESSTVLSLPGAKVPGGESSTYGTFAPGSESTRERKFHNSRAPVATWSYCICILLVRRSV